MRVRIELTENDLRMLVLQYVRNKVGDIELTEDKVSIQVKSKQNYKSEWEQAEFKAIYEDNLT